MRMRGRVCMRVPVYAAGIARLLSSGKKEIKKEACWMVSNITAGHATQIDQVCAAGLVPPLLELTRLEEFDIRKEAAYALCNACTGGSFECISGLVYHGLVPALVDLLEAPDTELLLAVCEALQAALAAGEASAAGGPNRCCALIEEAGGCERLEALQLHENPKVYAKAAAIIEAYFDDATAEDHALLPQATPDGYTFAPPNGATSISLS